MKTPVVLLLVTLLLASSTTGDELDDDAKEGFEKYANEEERDDRIITYAIKRLIVRPENDKYPYALKVNLSTGETPNPQEVQDEKNAEMHITYITPRTNPLRVEESLGSNETHPEDEEGGELGHKMQHNVTLKTSFIDLSKEIVSVAMGTRGLGYPVKGEYVVFRRNLNKTKHYVHLAYIRRQLSVYWVEWTMLDASLFGKSRLDNEFCRGVAVCELYHHILGLCGLVSRTCAPEEPHPEKPDEAEEAMLKKFTWCTNMVPANDTPVVGPQPHRRKRAAAAAPVATPAKDTLLDCVGCEKMNDFYSDFEEEVEFSKLISKRAKTLRKDLDKDIALRASNEEFLNTQKIPENGSAIPYLGLGPCNISKTEPAHLGDLTKEIEDLNKAYLATLRLQCDPKAENRVRGLYTSKFKLLEIQADYSVSLAKGSPVLKYKLLTTDEWRAVMTGAFTARFIRLWRQEYWPHVGKESPGDEVLSRDVRFFSKLMLNMVSSLTGYLNQHSIRGHRFVLRLIKDKFNFILVSVLGEVSEAPQPQPPPGGGGNGTEGGVDQRKINMWTYGLYRLMGLKEFILYGMGPKLKSGTDIGVAFDSFILSNEKRIRRLVGAYGVLEPKELPPTTTTPSPPILEGSQNQNQTLPMEKGIKGIPPAGGGPGGGGPPNPKRKGKKGGDQFFNQ